jgi:thioredoxin reductase
MEYDVIVIGGSYAGMAATLQLVRARKRVLVIDAGQRRNRYASHSYGFLGQDGVAPDEIARTARAQLLAYPTLTWCEGTASAAAGERDAFTVTMADGQTQRGRRLLLVTGVVDQLPPVPGLAERWGQSVFHCPYCHGYELDRGSIGVIATSAMQAHQAEMLTDWGQVTMLTSGILALELPVRRALVEHGVTIDDTGIERIDGQADVVLADGRRLSFAGLFAAPHCLPAGSLPATLGCGLEETPMGMQVRTDAAKETSVKGVFACGDLARAPHSVTLAVADGAWAGVQVHRSLLWPDAS